MLPITDSIKCGETWTGYLGGSPDSVSYTFTNDVVQSVSFTDCGTSFDPKLYLMDSTGTKIQDQSTNNCDGDDCTDPNYPCDDPVREAFTMKDLAVGTYTVQLTPWTVGGDWSLAVHCDGALSVGQPTQKPTTTTESGYVLGGYVNGELCHQLVVLDFSCNPNSPDWQYEGSWCAWVGPAARDENAYCTYSTTIEGAGSTSQPCAYCVAGSEHSGTVCMICFILKNQYSRSALSGMAEPTSWGSAYYAHVGGQKGDDIDRFNDFEAIGAMTKTAPNTWTVAVTGKDLFILVLVILNVFTLIVLISGCTKCCKVEQRKVQYEEVAVVSE